uniref:Uncharacterized protein n=1 Tax=Anguilla anguilla TaxID=7936 RepID=A0A0E9X9C1_ANGAN
MGEEEAATAWFVWLQFNGTFPRQSDYKLNQNQTKRTRLESIRFSFLRMNVLFTVAEDTFSERGYIAK